MVAKEAIWDDLLQQLDAIAWVAAGAGLRFSFVSREAERRLGYPTSRWLGEPGFFAALLHPDDRDPILALCRAVAADGEGRVGEHRVLTADGRERWFRTAVRPAGAGQLAGLMLDVTAEMGSRQERDRLRQMVERSPDGIAVHCDGRFVYANQTALEYLGRARLEDLAGAPVLDAIHPDDRPAVLQQIRAMEETGQPAPPQEVRLLRPDGASLTVEKTARPIDYEGRRASLTFLRDATARKQAQEDLKSTHEEMASIIVHDLRDPIQNILLQTHLMSSRVEGGQLRGPVDPLYGVERSAHRLGRIAGDILDLIQVEIGRIQLHRQLLNLPLSAAALFEQMRPALSEHPLEMQVRGDLPMVYLDAMRLAQILHNLLDNASKYSASGTKITVRLAPRQGGAEVAVEDRGVGIAPEELPKIFTRFYGRGHASEHRDLGVGLYITKGLVEAQGGRLWAESERGRGSTFYVWFPGATPARASGSP